MIKAVLLDLDNTLLRNPDSRFSDAFGHSLRRHFAMETDRQDLSLGLRQAMSALNDNRDWMTSNEQVINHALAEELDLSPERTRETLDAFYANEYAELQSCTAVMPGARELIEALLRRDLLVAIATNPLFPESAIVARLAWAGLADLIPDFRFITHSGNMHFIKPNPAYYAELAARIGIEPDEALMLGDSLINDIRPARSIGICAWHIRDSADLARATDAIAEADWAARMSAKPLNQSMLKPQFEGNIAALYGLLAESAAHQWGQQPDPDEWSILQILCHLEDTESTVHQARLRTILDEDNPFLRALQPPGPHLPPCHDDAYAVLDSFRQKRIATLSLLGSVRDEAWNRPARHSIFGLTTLLEMAYFTAQHDRLHVNQLCQTLGKCVDSIA